MKTLFTLLLLLFAFSGSAQADSPLAYRGPFSMAPEGAHRDGVSGQIYLFQNTDEQVTEVRLILNAPVFGRPQLHSTELVSRLVQLGAGGLQKSVVFKLAGPPHRWYYALVGISQDGGASYRARLFEVNAELEEILAMVETRRESVPQEWKLLSEVELQRE